MDDARELLLAMSVATREQALRVLSDDGREVLELIELVVGTSEISVVDAWTEARATADLSERDNIALVAYAARMELLEQFGREEPADDD